MASALLTKVVSVATAHEFVPICMVEQCGKEAIALGNDTYSRSLGSCLMTSFGPCANDAWECLGDSRCQQALQCVPKVLGTCQDSIWKMVTDPVEREKATCMLDCEKDGKIDPLCVFKKCGKAAIGCLKDPTCMKAVTCVPNAMLDCSGEAFACVFGTDKVCQKNLQCLGHGVVTCAAPSINILTDSKIVDFISCAGKNCPHPAPPHHNKSDDVDESDRAVSAPNSTSEQLLCMAAKCGKNALQILADQDTKDLLTCLTKGDLPALCPSAWNCLADDSCRHAVSCWATPFETCNSDMWHLLTDVKQRKRIEDTVSCVSNCGKDHVDDFVDATFCVLESCGQSILDCNNDKTCREAVKCVPKTLGQCALPQLESFIQNELFKNATKCVGRGLELCGAAAVEMLRNQDIAEAVTCAAQCTIPPSAVIV